MQIDTDKMMTFGTFTMDDRKDITAFILLNIYCSNMMLLTLKVLVTTIDAQWEGMGDVGLARYELALLPPCPTITVLSYSK